MGYERSESARLKRGKNFRISTRNLYKSQIFLLFFQKAKIPARRRFFRSLSPPSPPLHQATIGTSVHTQLFIRPNRPGPRPQTLEQCPHLENTAGRKVVGGQNDKAVTEIFRSYQHEFSNNNLNLTGDTDDNEVYRRYSYTREHKLAAIDMATTTWSRRPDGSLEPVSRYYVAKRLRISQPNLTRWIKNKHRILALKVGAQRLQTSRVGQHPDLEKKLNLDFEAARSIGRQITHHWFLR